MGLWRIFIGGPCKPWSEFPAPLDLVRETILDERVREVVLSAVECTPFPVPEKWLRWLFKWARQDENRELVELVASERINALFGKDGDLAFSWNTSYEAESEEKDVFTRAAEGDIRVSPMKPGLGG